MASTHYFDEKGEFLFCSENLFAESKKLTKNQRDENFINECKVIEYMREVYIYRELKAK